MKKIINIFSILTVILLLSACEVENLQTTFSQEDKGIPIRLNLTNKTVASRAAYYTENGVTGYNENVINRADVFFYTDKDANAVYKISNTWDSSQEQTATLNGNIPVDIVENTTTLYAYAIVNGPTTPEVADGTDTKIATLKQIGIEADFTTFTQTGGKTYSQTEFVMDGENTVTYDPTANKVNGNIYLNRAASKIALFITNLEPFVDGEQKTWIPQETGMSVSFYNGVSHSRIDVGAANDRTTGHYFSLSDKLNDNTDDDRFSFYTATSDNDETPNVDESKAYTHFPFYSYSSDWGRETNPDNEAYLSLRIYWLKEGETTPEPYYYRVPINLEDYTAADGSIYPGKQLQRNTYYKVLLEVGVLGDKSEHSEVELTPNYIVVDWNDEPVEVQLADYRYLIVEKNEDKVYNQNFTFIKYQTSHDTKVVITKISRPYMKYTSDEVTEVGETVYYEYDTTNGETITNADGTSTTLLGVSSVEASATIDDLYDFYKTCTVSLEEEEIVMSHELINTRNDDNYTYNITHTTTSGGGGPGGNNSSTTTTTYKCYIYDYSPYTITLRIYHTDKPDEFTETITITQYPSCYVEWEEDEGRMQSHTSTNYQEQQWYIGTVWINGNGGINTNLSVNNNEVKSSTDNSEWNSAPNKFSPSNKENNPYMLTFTVTEFDTTYGTDFIIADSRETEITDPGADWVEAPALYDGTTNRELKYYYKTRTDNENYISPQFMIASAYGQPGGASITATTAVQRCAAYQEYGYPAGRWRVPTAAELQYMGKMCIEGKIPFIFNEGNAYWSATGSYVFSGGTFTAGTKDRTSVRCVYDKWYWQDKCDVDVFTWGDQPR